MIGVLFDSSNGCFTVESVIVDVNWLFIRLSATKEVKMTSTVNDINAYSYLYPAELPSRKFVFKWLLELLVNALPLLIGNEDKLIWEADPSVKIANSLHRAALVPTVQVQSFPMSLP
ncbi:hypothetical protein TEA_012689 [Camellia sinensis var. sinensis]|uniref:Uncharacterized protein n=1 Tax=Camellia sinensis var. sinensis TaxID=542762 RepID=A0A4S4EAE8_CAMSN|nr:hypothetical protein TEA_012689 [Camellia sinensis var. sinensis]